MFFGEIPSGVRGALRSVAMRMEPMKKFAAAALAGLALASTPSQAADLFGTAAPPMSAPDNPAVEVGSNWYIRGDVGLTDENSPTIVPSAGLIPSLYSDTPGTGAVFDNQPIGNASTNAPVTRGNNGSSQNVVFGGGFGYRVNNYVRLEADYSFFNGPGLGYQQKTLCPNTTSAVSNTVNVTTTSNGVSTTTPTSVPVGYIWDPVPCTGVLNATQYNNLVMGSAYFDLGTFWGFTPYVGAGAGLNANTISGTTTFTNNNDGSAFLGNTSATGTAPLRWVTLTGTDGNGNPVYTPLNHQPNVAFGTQNWNRHFLSTKISVAGALMAGFGFQLTPSATLDIGYRYLNLDLSGTTHNTAQQLTVGVRYMLN
jgi:opacity protein-like surface antigen